MPLLNSRDRKAWKFILLPALGLILLGAGFTGAQDRNGFIVVTLGFALLVFSMALMSWPTVKDFFREVTNKE